MGRSEDGDWYHVDAVEALAHRVAELETLLSNGCALLDAATECTRAGVRDLQNGGYSTDPSDAPAVAEIAEAEAWIAQVSEAIRRD